MLQLFNFVVADSDGIGIIAFSFYASRSNAVTIQHGLQWAAGVALSLGGFEWVPSTVMCDDDQALYNAVSAAFPHCLCKLCVWHILARNATAHLNSLVGASGETIAGIIWRLVRQPRADAIEAEMHAAIDEVHRVLDCPVMGQFSPWHVDTVHARLRSHGTVCEVAPVFKR